jgi:hypothetical protein
MKKQYISPETLSLRLNLEGIMQAGTITNIDSTTTNPIDTGGDAGDGEGSDSRRHRDMWEDEEEDY